MDCPGLRWANHQYPKDWTFTLAKAQAAGKDRGVKLRPRGKECKLDDHLPNLNNKDAPGSGSNWKVLIYLIQVEGQEPINKAKSKLTLAIFTVGGSHKGPWNGSAEGNSMTNWGFPRFCTGTGKVRDKKSKLGTGTKTSWAHISRSRANWSSHYGKQWRMTKWRTP